MRKESVNTIVFRESHENVVAKELIPIKSINYTNYKSYNLDSKSLSEIKILKLEIPPDIFNYIYYQPSAIINRFIYLRNYVYHEIFSLNIDAWEMFRYEEVIRYKEEIFKESILSGDYKSFFALMEKKLLIDAYLKLINEISLEQKYDIFTDVYIRSEYGFDKFSIEFLKDLFRVRLNSKDWEKRIEKLNNKYSEQSSLVIYRGVTDQSNSLEQSFSWTLNIEVAEFFAKRFDSKGKVYRARVNLLDVIDYFEYRNEAEVLVLPESVKEIRIYRDFQI